MIERRAVARHKTFIKGRIIYNNRLSSLDCIVRDATEKGGRLEFYGSVAIPDAFELHFPNKDEHYQAHVEWRKGNHVGVSWCPDQPPQQGGESSGGRSERSLADRVAKLEQELAALQRRFDNLQET
jgi:hypothetical protein